MRHVFYECGICDQIHPWEWDGDCRDDANRYGDMLEIKERLGSFDELDIEIRLMSERVSADMKGA